MIVFFWFLIIAGALGFIGLWIFNNRNRCKFFWRKKGAIKNVFMV
jgi:hypothetical protein